MLMKLAPSVTLYGRVTRAHRHTPVEYTSPFVTHGQGHVLLYEEHIGQMKYRLVEFAFSQRQLEQIVGGRCIGLFFLWMGVNKCPQAVLTGL
jgi:hypothetical protein